MAFTEEEAFEDGMKLVAFVRKGVAAYKAVPAIDLPETATEAEKLTAKIEHIAAEAKVTASLLGEAIDLGIAIRRDAID